MADGDELIKEGEHWAVIVPSMFVTDLDRSIDVYTRLFGFESVHAEPELAVLALAREQLVLRQLSLDAPEVPELTAPFGRGITLNVRTEDPRGIYQRLRDDKYPIAVPMEMSELTEGEERYSRTTFTVEDPDGYRLQFTD